MHLETFSGKDVGDLKCFTKPAGEEIGEIRAPACREGELCMWLDKNMRHDKKVQVYFKRMGFCELVLVHIRNIQFDACCLFPSNKVEIIYFAKIGFVDCK